MYGNRTRKPDRERKRWDWKRKTGKMTVSREAALNARQSGPIDQAGLLHRVLAAWQRRRIYLTANNLQSFRLATREEMQLPLAVDVYGATFSSNGGDAILTGGAAVIQIYDEFLPDGTLDGVEKLLASQFSLHGFYDKKRYRAKDSPDAGGSLNEAPVELVVEEYGHKFLVNLNNYLDCGLFLDHRETRRRVERMMGEMRLRQEGKGQKKANGPVLLNLFGYTGSFSVYAAAGGAAMTHTVDLSKTYCDWARRNFALNAMPEESHWIYRMDAFEFFRYAIRKELSFDLIVIDPPTFSRSSSGTFSVQKDHVRLLQEAARLLRDDGVIVFSNNCLDFRMADEICADFEVRDIQNETIPQDFWLNTIPSDWWASGRQIHNCFLIRKKSS
jgi:23S rRNA (cytosine1962-C5)-methyltransferase